MIRLFHGATLCLMLFGLSLAPKFAKAFESATAFEQDQAEYKALVFLSQSCPCSKSHVEHLNKLSLEYKNIALYGVITDIFNEKNKQELEDYYKDKNFKFPVIKDEKQLLIKKYKALKTPHSVVLNQVADGKYKIIYQGGVSDHRDFDKSKKHFLKENLSSLSKGQPLKYAVGRSLGCYIRRL